MVVRFRYQHNHSTDSAAALKHKDVSDETRSTLIALIKEGHSPAAALEALKTKVLGASTGQSYARKAADRSIIPDYSFVRRYWAHPRATRKLWYRQLYWIVQSV